MDFFLMLGDDMAWYGLVWDGMGRYGMRWYGMVEGLYWMNGGWYGGWFGLLTSL